MLNNRHLWLWLDSRSSRKEKQKIIASILLKSRKRGVTIAYTTQSIHQVEKRIRDITDFIAYPMMNLDNSWCRLEIFRGPKPSMATRIKPPIYFSTAPIYAVYNTYEEIKQIPDEEERSQKTELQETYTSIMENPALIKHLVEDKGFKTQQQVIAHCKKLMKEINPKEIKKTLEDSLDDSLTGL